MSLKKVKEAALATMGKREALKELSAGEFAKLKLNPLLTARSTLYKAKKTGNVCLLETKTGIMNILAINVTPFEYNVPLLSVDYMFMMGKQVMMVEFFDTGIVRDEAYEANTKRLVEVAQKYSGLTDYEMKENWYSALYSPACTAKSGDFDTVNQMLVDFLDAYCEILERLEPLTGEALEQRKQAVQEFSDNMIDKGGISTDVFVKSLGADKVRSYFDQVFFGTKR